MIHFSSQIVNSRSIAYPASEPINSATFSSACHRLFKTMGWGSGDGSMTGAQERAYLDFCSWVEQLKDSCYGANRTKNSAYFYCNMNTGESIMFIAWYGYEEYDARFLEL